MTKNRSESTEQPAPKRKVAILTGASSGVGWATAVYLSKRSYDLCVTARNAEALERLAQIVRSNGARCEVVPGDVTDMEDVSLVVSTCMNRFGRIDALINNAAIQPYDFFENYTWDEIVHVNDVNYFGYLRFARAVLRHMRAQGFGVIVNVLSVLDQAGLQYFSVYSASKHALLGWAKCLTLELKGSGVEIANVVLPSLNTPIYDHSLNRTGARTKPLPPIYDVEIAAKAIEKMIRKPKIKDVPVFTQGALVLWLDYALPGLGRFLMTFLGIPLQKRKTPEAPNNGNFWMPPLDEGAARGTLKATPRWKRFSPLIGLLLLSSGAAVKALGKSRSSAEKRAA